MRTGRFSQILARPWVTFVAFGALAVSPLVGHAQAPPNRMAGPMDPYAGPMPGPNGYYMHDPTMGGPHHMHGPQQGFGGPMPMGDGGTCPPVGYDLMNDAGMEGYQVDQRGPHYFDVRAEAVYLTRDETFGEEVEFTREGVAPTGITRLTSDQLEYDWTPGFRIIGRYDICPLAVIEFGYTGIFDFEDSASFVDPNAPDLYSLWSGFGDETVFPDVTDVGGPAPQSERAQEHSISIESDLQTAEIMYRRYWVGYIPRISGQLMAGFRYTRLSEEFEFNTLGSETVPVNTPGGELASMEATTDAVNNLSGFQAGGDIWMGLFQGVRIGAEGKAGLYANAYKVTNSYDVTPPPNPLLASTPPLFLENEVFEDTQPAFIAEASADVVVNVLPSVALRAGYEVLFMNELVLAGDNFNTGSPYHFPGETTQQGVPRVPFLVNDGDVFYHGGHAGIEFVW